MANFGYKTNKTGFSFGTNFEFYDDLNLGLGNSNYYEKMVTDSTASERQKKQEGNYWDSFLNIDFDYDKRNQKFQTTEGYRSQYFISVPIVSETNSLSNTYNYQYYSELYEGNVSNISLYMKSINSLSNDDVKLSERIFIPSIDLGVLKAVKWVQKMEMILLEAIMLLQSIFLQQYLNYLKILKVLTFCFLLMQQTYGC